MVGLGFSIRCGILRHGWGFRLGPSPSAGTRCGHRSTAAKLTRVHFVSQKLELTVDDCPQQRNVMQRATVASHDS
jgi:hypothetical protein